MYIVNTSFMVESAVHEPWYRFFVEKFMPYVRERGFGCDGAHRIVFTRVLTDNGDSHYTYSLQVEVPDTAEYRRFESEILEEYVRICGPLFGDQALYFTTLLKKIAL